MSVKVRWAARCWHWRSEEAKHAWKRLAAHPLATSPGLYDVMRGTPSSEVWGEWDWEVYEEVRP